MGQVSKRYLHSFFDLFFLLKQPFLDLLVWLNLLFKSGTIAPHASCYLMRLHGYGVSFLGAWLNLLPRNWTVVSYEIRQAQSKLVCETKEKRQTYNFIKIVILKKKIKLNYEGFMGVLIFSKLLVIICKFYGYFRVLI